MKARDKMAYAQYLAGIAFNNASLGYVHAMEENIVGLSTDEAVVKAMFAICRISRQVGITASLKELGVKSEDFSIMEENAMKDVCCLTNPCKATKE